jgi:hypothetical protein
MARRTKAEMAIIKENQAKIDTLLKGNNAEMAAFRAVLAIWKRQTEDEQSSKCTSHDNGIGFSQADATHGSVLAEWMMGFGWNHVTTRDDAAKDGKFRRRPAGSMRRAGKMTTRVDIAKELAWKYRAQLRMIAYGA